MIIEKEDIKNLKFRYLLWLYKTVKEEFDRIERRFTQLEIDKKIYESIGKKMKHFDSEEKKRLNKCFEEFHQYILKKEQDGQSLKFEKEKNLRPKYTFLRLKLKAIKQIIVKELGQEAKNQIKALYEEEMKRRILESGER